MDSHYLFRSMIARCALLCLLITAPVFSRPVSPGEFQAWIRNKYAFSPQNLTPAEITEKSKVLDEVWNEVSERQQELVPCLREELARPNHPPFFYFNGSQLLLSLSLTSADKALAAAAITRSDVRDVQPDSYFRLLLALAADGCDITEAALNIVNKEPFRVFVSAHALTLGADYSLIYLLNFSNPPEIVPKLIARFETTERESARIALIRALWYTLDPQALAYVDRLPRVEEMSEKLRECIVALRQRHADRGQKTPAANLETDLRARRQKTLLRLSDEALDEYEELTDAILAQRKR